MDGSAFRGLGPLIELLYRLAIVGLAALFVGFLCLLYMGLTRSGPWAVVAGAVVGFLIGSGRRKR